jgi:acyl-CoA thioester hydrolase
VEGGEDEVVVRDIVRWSDVDAAGIVCFARYLRFFELGETELFRRAGLPVQVLRDQHGVWLVRRRVECEFLRPLRLDGEIDIAARVTHLGCSSLRLRFEATDPTTGALCAEGGYVCVSVDRESLEPIPIPHGIRAALQPFVVREASPVHATPLPVC